MVFAQNKENLQVEIKSGRHLIRSDEPVQAGGDDTGPNPYELLLSSLAACKVITVQMYARRKGWSLEGVQVALNIYKIHAKDCEDCESDPEARIDLIETQISLKGDLSPEQLERLVEISERCPVHRTLTSETKIRTELVETIQ